MKEYANIKELPTDFTKGVDGHSNVHFVQLAKSGNAYIYKREIKDYADYEVFKRIVNQAAKRLDNGKWEPLEGCGYVSYPRANHFGVWAHSFGGVKALERAISHFNEISDTPFDECRVAEC